MKPGELIASKYRLERVLGVGGMGTVWAAVNESTGRAFAIKLMHSLPPEFRVRLLREARAGGTLKHKSVVDIYDVGETESGDPFLVMELLSGETLADCLKREGPLPPARAIEVALSIASALRVAHAKGIVHRDVKPANIFLHREAEGEAEVVKVLDFGASKHLQEVSATVAGSLVGSPAYMSPEQARADPKIDGRSDLWSLGVVLFEMLAGHRPFRATTTYAVIADVIASPIPSITDSVGGLRPALVHVVERCLTRDVDARIQSADELIGVLGTSLDDVASSGEEASTHKWEPGPASSQPTERSAGGAGRPGSADVHATVAPMLLGGGTPAVAGRERSAARPAATRLRSIAFVAAGACTAALLSVIVLNAAWRRPPRASERAISAATTEAPEVAAPGSTSTDAPVVAATPVEPAAEEGAPVASASSAPALPRQLGKGEAMIVVDAPPTTSVSLDGEAVGITPVAPIIVRAGPHRISFKHPTLGERVAVVEAQAGETNLASTQFGKETGAPRAPQRVHPSGEKRLVLP